MSLTKEARLERIMRLKKQFFSHKPSVCIEGALTATRVFQETESEPMVIRRAKVFKRHCRNQDHHHPADELSDGNAGAVARSIHVNPELSNNWFYNELDTMSTRPQDPYQITEEQKRLYREEIYPYWKGKTLRDFWDARAPKDVHELFSVGGICDNDVKIECTPGDMVPALHQLVLPLGFDGIKRQGRRKPRRAGLQRHRELFKA